MPGTHHYLGGTTKQGRNQPLWGMMIPEGPLLCTHHAGEQYSMAYPSLSMIPHCRRISLLSCKISSAELVPTTPMCQLHFLLTELVTSASGLSSWTEHSRCLKIHRVAYRGEMGGLLFPGLSSDCTEEQEPSKHSINPSVCTSFPSFLVESVLRGKLRHGRTGAVPV